MKTKYVISGGNAKHNNAENDDFFKEILKDTPEELSVLIVMFARKGEGVERSYETAKQMFERNKSSKKILYSNALHSKLAQQIKDAHVVYIHGGENLAFIHEMRQYPDFAAQIKGKIIAGESAGTYLLSSVFYSKTIGRLEEGLGILPIKVICHFAGLHEEKLDSVSSDLKKVLLKDYQYKVYCLYDI